MNFSKKLIYISDDMTAEDQMLTLLHECHHVIGYINGDVQVSTHEQFETRAETYANGFLDVLKSLK